MRDKVHAEREKKNEGYERENGERKTNKQINKIIK